VAIAGYRRYMCVFTRSGRTNPAELTDRGRREKTLTPTGVVAAEKRPAETLGVRRVYLPLALVYSLKLPTHTPIGQLVFGWRTATTLGLVLFSCFRRPRLSAL